MAVFVEEAGEGYGSVGRLVSAVRGGRRLETATEQTTLNFFSHLPSCVLLLLVYDIKLYYKAISPEESEASSLSFQNLPPSLLSPVRKAAPALQLASRYVIRQGKKRGSP